MPDAYLDKGLDVLRAYLRAKHPGIVIGWIGDPAHQSGTSDHNPEADGSVDAIDPMIGPSFTFAECQEFIDDLVATRDPRLAYVIWNKRIISSTISPWTWRAYTGDDPHTGHAHISVNDKHENDTSDWGLDVAFRDEKIPLTKIAGAELYEPDRAEGTEVLAHNLVQTAAIYAQRASTKSTANATTLAKIVTQNAQILANLAALAGKDFVDEKALTDYMWSMLPSRSTDDLVAVLRKGATAEQRAAIIAGLTD